MKYELQSTRNKMLSAGSAEELFLCRKGSLIITSQAGTSVCTGMWVYDTWGIASLIANSGFTFSIKSATQIGIKNNTGKSCNVSIVF